MPRNPHKTRFQMPSCRNWATRGHTHCRHQLVPETGLRGAGAPPAPPPPRPHYRVHPSLLSRRRQDLLARRPPSSVHHPFSPFISPSSHHCFPKRASSASSFHPVYTYSNHISTKIYPPNSPCPPIVSQKSFPHPLSSSGRAATRATQHAPRTTLRHCRPPPFVVYWNRSPDYDFVRRVSWVNYCLL
jgi:hypothetical protein